MCRVITGGPSLPKHDFVDFFTNALSMAGQFAGQHGLCCIVQWGVKMNTCFWYFFAHGLR